MTTLADHLDLSFAGLSLDEALQQPVHALLGVSEEAADALSLIGVRTVFDLGSSWLFANAAAAIQASAGPPGSASTDLLRPDAAPTAPDDVASLPLETLRGVSDDDAAAIRTALDVTTIREFALWPPRTIARRLVGEATGATPGDLEEEQAEALRPRLGEFPTERVYYDSLVMLAMGESPDRKPLTGTISLQPVIDEPLGFGQPAVGAQVTCSQSWYAEGITLGHMLHSLALAPGEATRIAVVDWSRRTRATVAETIEEAERLDTASEHSRAISEVQNAVAEEMQSGGSMSSGWAKSTSKGKSGGFSIGGGVAGAFKGATGVLGFGGGTASSRQEAETRTEARSSSWSIGSRSVMAEMAQRVNDRTEQHSTSVRNRRASAVREVAQSEHEEVSTRIVANYNHMHALTIQYYEVVQVYRVVAQVHSVQRVLFLPFELLSFAGEDADDVVARFRAQLVAAALTERVRGLLLDDRGAIEIRAAVRVTLPVFAGEIGSGATVATAFRFAPDGPDGPGGGPGGAPPGPGPGPGPVGPPTLPAPPGDGVLTAPPPPSPRPRFLRPGPVVDTVAGDAELTSVSFDGVAVDRVRVDQAGVPAADSTFVVPGATNQVDLPVPIPLRAIQTVHVAGTGAAGGTGTMTLGYETGGRQRNLAVPVDLGDGTTMQKVAFFTADPANRREELETHLQANRAYYTRAVLEGLDSATLVMLLSAFTWRGKPLADQVEPNPLAVAGNFLVLRAPVEDEESAGIGDGTTTWGELVEERALTSDQHDARLVPIPTGGVFAEAVLGRSNAAEKLDITRFWNWQDSPIPLQPPEIAPVGLASRAQAEDLRPGQLGQPVLNILNPTQLPDPTGLGASLSALTAANMFRDMSGLAGTQGLAQAGAAGTLGAATEAGQIASANLKTVTDQAVAMGKAAADMWKAANAPGGGGEGGGGGGGTGKSVSADGARINHGRDMDKRGVSGAASAGSMSGAPKVTESKAEFQAAGGGSDGGQPPVSRELAFADTAATGVSPGLLGGTVNALGGGSTAASMVGMGGLAASPGSIGHAMKEGIALGSMRVDVEASGLSLKGVDLHPMRLHRFGQKFRAIGLFAWTHSATEIYVDLDTFFAVQDGNAACTASHTASDPKLYARAFAVLVLRHEVSHIQQFAKAGGPPGSFKDMVELELESYDCPGSKKPKAPGGLRWLNDKSQDGARHYLLKKLKLPAADANELLQCVDQQWGTACKKLDVIKAKTLEKDIRADLIADEFVPAELVQGQGGTYAVGDLYPTNPKKP